nr:SAM-dependent methyltransferase [Micromonospora sp. DSM 115978]
MRPGLAASVLGREADPVRTDDPDLTGTGQETVHGICGQPTGSPGDDGPPTSGEIGLGRFRPVWMDDEACVRVETAAVTSVREGERDRQLDRRLSVDELRGPLGPRLAEDGRAAHRADLRLLPIYRQRGIPGTARTRVEVERFFEGMELVDPGIELVHHWRPDDPNADAPADEQVSV